jgi:hypothetical protein
MSARWVCCGGGFKGGLLPETQFLLLQLEDDGSSSSGYEQQYALLLPLIDGDFRGTLRPNREVVRSCFVILVCGCWGCLRIGSAVAEVSYGADCCQRCNSCCCSRSCSSSSGDAQHYQLLLLLIDGGLHRTLRPNRWVRVYATAAALTMVIY